MPEQEVIAESGAQVDQGSDWDTPPESETTEVQQTAAPSTGDVKTEGDTGQLAAEQGQDTETPVETTPEAKIDPAEYESLKAQVAEMEQLKQTAAFYQQLYNEKYQSEQLQQPVNTPKGEEQTQLPDGVLPPEKWQNQNDMLPYMDHMITTKAEGMLKNAWEQQVVPVVNKLQNYVARLEDVVMRSQYKDFEELVEGNKEKGIKGVIHDLFTIDPSGKVIGVKDAATVAMIQNSPLPRKALYDYAVSRKAPELIAKQKQETTKNLLNKLDTKPKITRPASSAAGANEADTLDWDTPPELAEKILAKKGLIR